MSTTSVPPRFVPTLTDVVQPFTHSYGTQTKIPPSNHPQLQAIASSDVLGHAIDNGLSAPTDDFLIKRVMQRIDLVLERRLQEALGRIILEQTESLAPKLRHEIEQAVRETVARAVAQELSER